MSFPQSFRHPALALLVLAGPFLIESPASGQVAKLSGPLARSPGDVRGFLVSPDGERVVYLADQDEFETYHLFSAPSDASQAPVQLSPEAIASSFVESVAAISPDGTSVVHTTGFGSSLRRVPIEGGANVVLVPDGVWEFHLTPLTELAVYLGPDQAVYSVPIAGGAPIRLSPPGHSVGLSDFVTSPDGLRVVYVVEERLYSVPSDGSAAPVELKGSPGPPVQTLRVTPGNDRVVYQAGIGRLGFPPVKLYSVPIDGNQGPVELNGPLVPGGGVGHAQLFPFLDKYWIAPDGSRVLYLADAEVDERIELYSVPTDGSQGPTKLSGTLAGGNGDVRAVEIDPLGCCAVYVADEAVQGHHELYSVPLDGSAAPEKISGPLVPGGGVGGPDQTWFSISPAGQRVVYTADQGVNHAWEVFSVPVEGGQAPRKLNGVLVAGGDAGEGDSEPGFRISADGNDVLYRADQDVDGVFELFSVPIDASSAPVQVSGPLVLGGDVELDFEISAQGDVLYRADQDVVTGFELYSASLEGGAGAVQLNGALSASGVVGDVTTFEVTPDQRSVVYRADQDTDGVFDLYLAPLDGESPATKLNPSFQPDPDGYAASSGVFAVTPDGTRLVYTADPESEGVFGVFSVLMDGSQSAIRLSAPIAPSEVLTSFIEVSSDGSRVVYQVNAAPMRLYSAPTDGSAAAVQLNLPLHAGASIGPLQRFAITPDGSRVVYRSDQEVDERNELYSVPTDGSASPTKLSGTLPAFGDVDSFQITPDSARVVFRADRTTDGVFGLYTRAFAGGPIVELNGPLAADGDVATFQVTPDSIGVVYLADAEVDERVELYAVPFAAPSAFKLNDPLVAGGDVMSFQISPDDARVVYGADQGVDERYELFSVPIDRSQAPIRLNGPLVTAGDVEVTWYLIDAQSKRVVYHADQDVNDRIDLYSARIDGGAPSVRLTRLPPTAVIQPHRTRISPDGSWVVFLSDAEVDDRYELFRIPIRGGERPMKLNGPLALGGDVSPGFQSAFQLTGTGRAVYIADQQKDGVNDLYMSVIASPARRASR